jgi:hypothetical protein
MGWRGGDVGTEAVGTVGAMTWVIDDVRWLELGG